MNIKFHDVGFSLSKQLTHLNLWHNIKLSELPNSLLEDSHIYKLALTGTQIKKKVFLNFDNLKIGYWSKARI